MDEPRAQNSEWSNDTSTEVDRLFEGTFDGLSTGTKVMVSLFTALNSASTLTKELMLSDRLWEKMYSQVCGHL